MRENTKIGPLKIGSVLFGQMNVKLNYLEQITESGVGRSQNAPLDFRSVKPTIKYGAGNIMVWGCFTSKGDRFFLCQIENGLDSALYREILNDEFKATVNWYQMDLKEIIFQQDNDPKHTAKLTKQWFENNNIKSIGLAFSVS